MLFFFKRRPHKEIEEIFSILKRLEQYIHTQEMNIAELWEVTKKYPRKRIYTNLETAAEARNEAIKEGYQYCFKEMNIELWVKKEEEDANPCKKCTCRKNKQNI